MMKGLGNLGNLGGLGDLGGILKQAQSMQKNLQKIQEELKERVVEASSGGGMVTAQASGAGDLVAVKISKDVVDPDDVDMLEDLVVAAVNASLKKSKELREAEMGKATGGLNIPGLF